VSTTRQGLLALIEMGPRTASSLALELRVGRQRIEEDLRHVIRTARAAGRRVTIEPSRCKACGFTFDESRLLKPSRCPACKGTRLYEALIRIQPG
jgi:predicted Zn-ribbon and HTH transcriptional regulator